MIAALLFALTLSGAQDAAEPPRSGPDGRIWYPRAALIQGLEGRVVLDCVVQADGSVKDCVILEEDPKGAGFGESALKMSAIFRMKMVTKDGQAVPPGAKVKVPLRFTQQDDAPAKPSP